MTAGSPKDNWFTTDLVTQVIAQEIWEKFPHPVRQCGKIVWEYGDIEIIVDFALHGSKRQHFLRKLEVQRAVTLATAAQACAIADKLANTKPADLLLLFGVEDCPRDLKLTKAGALEALAAEVLEKPLHHLHRIFERASRNVSGIRSKLKAAQKQRLEQIGELGRASNLNPEVASKFPEVFKLLDKRLRRDGS